MQIKSGNFCPFFSPDFGKVSENPIIKNKHSFCYEDLEPV